jgi:hypothetical protein
MKKITYPNWLLKLYFLFKNLKYYDRAQGTINMEDIKYYNKIKTYVFYIH